MTESSTESLIKKIQEKFPSECLMTHQEKGDATVVIRRDRCHEILKFLKEDPDLGFDMMMDLCGVDYLKLGEKPRFELVYHLYSVSKNHRFRIRVKLPDDDLSVPTVTDLWKAADWFERETYDMFGFIFQGHPNLKRLLLFEGFEGYPLRKDYPIDRRQKIPMPEEKV